MSLIPQLGNVPRLWLQDINDKWCLVLQWCVFPLRAQSLVVSLVFLLLFLFCMSNFFFLFFYCCDLKTNGTKWYSFVCMCFDMLSYYTPFRTRQFRCSFSASAWIQTGTAVALMLVVKQTNSSKVCRLKNRTHTWFPLVQSGSPL